ncbi:MAG TPA: Ig-like domain-containing protein [Burkholderiaceae bacterium]|nr:Ig-like domain-containing protein [Burkholderiaceae bacterium]
MPTIIQTVQGRVTGLWGHASIRGADGKMHPLQLGDIVHRGDVILTSQDGIVRLAPEDNATALAAAPTKQPPAAGDEIDRVISALNESDPQAAPAAGLAGGDGAGDLTPGLRVDRIAEGVTSASFPARSIESDTPLQTATRASAPDSAQVPQVVPTLTAGSTTIHAAEEGSGVALGLPAPGGVSTQASVIVDHVPTIGQIVKADGTVVAAGTALTPADLTGLRYLPPADYNGTDPVGTFNYTVSDNGRSTSGSVIVDLAAVNDVPVAAADGATTPINVPTTIAVLANDSDRDGDSLTVTGASLANPAQGSVVVNADGTITFTPATNVSGPVAITYTVSDGHGGSASATATVTVGANHAPAGADAAHTLPEDGSYVVATADFGYSDSDAGQTFAAVRIDTIPAAGSLLLNGTTVGAGTLVSVADIAAGHLVFVPAANASGAPYANFGFSVQDSAGAFDPTPNTINFSVTPVNDPPVAHDDLASTPINTPATIAVLANDGDIDGDALTVTGATLADPTLGSVVLNADGTLAFTPASNVSGSVVIHYTVADPSGATSTATVTVTVGANTPPDAADATLTLAEDTSRHFAAADFGFSDADAGQTFANLRIDTLPAAGTLTFNGSPVVAGQVIAAGDLAQLVYAPAQDAHGTGYASFTFSVQDSAGAFDAAPNTITLDVTPVNDAPVAGDDLAATPINTAIAAIPVLVNDHDVDGDTLSVTAATLANPALGTVTINPDSTLSFTPASNVSGPVEIHYTVSDGHGGSASAVLTIDVGANTPPDGADRTVVMAEDTSRTFSASDFGYADIDAGQTFANLRIDTLPAAGTLTFNGSPVVASQVIAAGDLAQLVFTPAPDANGAAYASFTFSVQDSAGAFDTAPNTIGIDVTPVADPAVITGTSSGATVEDTTLTANGKLDVVDPDAGEAAFVAQTNTLGAHGTFSIDAAGHWSYTLNNADPAVQALGQGQTLPNETFTVQSIDGTAAQVTVTISGTDDAPHISTGAGTVVENTQPVTSGTLTASDVDNPTLAFVPATIAGSYGSLVLQADGQWTYTLDGRAESLAQGQTVAEPIAVQLNDGSTTTVAITITGTNDAPVAAADSGALNEGTTLAVAAANGVLANDTDIDAGDTKTVTAVEFGATSGSVGSALVGTYGTLTLNADGSYSYQATQPATTSLAQGQTATETFSYTMVDSAGASSTSTLTFTVTGVNNAPVASADSNTAIEDTPLVVTAGPASGLLYNDHDPDGGATLTITQFTIAGDPAVHAAGSAATIAGVGTLTIGADGSYSFTPASNYNGPVPVATYTVSDGISTDTATLTLNVTPVNDAPVLSLDANYSHNTVAVQPITGLFNTGQAADGSALSDGTLDSHYTVVSAPSGSTLAATATSLSWAWIANDADSTWIGNTGNEPTGTYGYQTTFTLQAGANPNSVHIAFDIATDNALRDILVNGVSTGIASNVQYREYTHVELDGLSAAFTSGVNTITFVVDNRDAGSPATSGPTGLRIDNITGSVAVVDGDSATHQNDYATIYVEGTPVAIGDDDVRIQDVDSPTLQSATITLTNPQAGDVLALGALPAGVAATVNATGTQITLSGTASLSDYQSAIKAIQFDNTSETPSGAVDRLVTIVVNDGAADSNIATTTIHVVPVNDAPVLDLDGNNSTASGTGYAGTFVENGAGVKVVDSDLTIQDVDSTVLHSATVHIGNVQPGDVLSAGAMPWGITAEVYDPTTGTLTLAGDASLADYQAALQTVTFSNGLDNLSAVARTIQITVNDGSGNSNVAVSTISVTPTDDAPVNTVPGAQTTNEDTTQVIAGISVADIDSTSLNTTLSVGSGTLSVLTGTGATITGNGSGSVTLSGTAAQINTAIAAISYKPAADYSGSATLTVQTSDGTLSSTSTVAITVAPVVDVPTLTSVAGSNWSSYTEDWQDRNVTSGSMSWTGSRAIEAGVGSDPAQSAYSTVQNPHTSLTPSTNVVMELESYGSGTNVFSSTVNFASAGQVVEIDFDTIHRTVSATSGSDATTQKFTVEWNGSVIGTYDPGSTSWSQADLQVTSLAGANTLTFRAADTTGTLGAIVDNISVKTIGDAAINTTAKLASLVGAATFGDTADNSERHTLAIDSIPVGATLSDGTHTFTATAGHTSATIYNEDDPSSATGGSNWDLAHLTLTPPTDYIGTVPLTITATATEIATGQTAVTHSDLPVTFVPTLATADTGTIGADNLSGNGGNDHVVGLDGNDTLNGNNGNDMVEGGLGNDSLSGGNGNDVLIGGKGNDTLTGGNGADVFKWSLADQGTTASPAADTINDFDNSSSGDKLDLRDLLVGEHSDAGNLANYLHFTSSGGNTIISISSSGAFNGSNYATATDQTITITGVNLTTPGTDAQIINDLLTRNKLVVEH